MYSDNMTDQSLTKIDMMDTDSLEVGEQAMDANKKVSYMAKQVYHFVEETVLGYKAQMSVVKIWSQW